MDDKALAGIAAFTALLVVVALFGRLHGNGRIGARGDRVFAGLLALPLISLLVQHALPEAAPGWKWIALAPLAIYTFLLAGTDLDWQIIKDHFTLWLIVGVGAIYIVAVVYAVLTT